MQLTNCTTEAELNSLYKDSSFALEGFDLDGINELVSWIEDFTKLRKKLAYVIKGKVMNNIYNLTGTNRYPDELDIVAIKLSDMENPLALVKPRFQVGARWFDDIVDNNLRREKEKSK